MPSNLGYARNVLIVTMADAVVAVGGGAGTLTEIAMAWQLGRIVVGLDVEGLEQRSSPVSRSTISARTW